MNVRRYMNVIDRLPPWVKFSLVGTIGFVLQIVVLQLLSGIVNYLMATIAAVELVVLHNFVWHEKFTWREGGAPGLRSACNRLARFHVSNGAISILGNLALMRLFVGMAKLPVAAATLLSVGLCSFANFFALERWVFGRARLGSWPYASLAQSAIKTRLRSENGT